MRFEVEDCCGSSMEAEEVETSGKVKSNGISVPEAYLNGISVSNITEKHKMLQYYTLNIIGW